MKKMILSLVMSVVSLVSFSQKNMYFASHDLTYFNTDINNYKSCEDSIVDSEIIDGYFVLYNVDLKNGIVTTADDENNIMRLYRVLVETKTKNKIHLVLSTNNEVSFLTINKKRNVLNKITHYSTVNNRIDGYFSNVLVDLK